MVIADIGSINQPRFPEPYLLFIFLLLAQFRLEIDTLLTIPVRLHASTSGHDWSA